MTESRQQRRQRTETTRRKPQRTCIACRRTRDKHELVRVVRGVSGAVCVDGSGKLSGRGAYLCATDACLERGLRGAHLENRLLIGAPLSREDRGRIRMEAQAIIRTRTQDGVVSP